jgi:hypothetical protein
MVNTFMTTSVEDGDYYFVKNAENLDPKRLGKQRVEAKQILDILYDLNAISILIFKEEPPQQFLPHETNVESVVNRYEEWCSFVKTTRARYLAPTQKYRLIRKHKNTYVAVTKKFLDDVVVQVPGSFEYCGLKYDAKTRKITPSDFKSHTLVKLDEGNTVARTKTIIHAFDERPVTLGFSSHPAVRMWAGYIRALEVYISSCIERWVDMGYVNNMSYTPAIPGEKFAQPLWRWYENSPVVLSHISSLRRKSPHEYHFLHNPPTLRGWYRYGYGWVPNYPREKLIDVAYGLDIDPEDSTDPVME